MKLPPLNALRAFEAAARHNGFVGASEELNVTRGAISRHVKLLEDHLGTQLFRRHPKGVDLTDSGRQLLPVVSEAFGQIAQVSDRLSSSSSDLRIICPPATSIRWLIPRLDDFRQKHPDIRVRLTTDFYGEIGLDSAEFDVGFSVMDYHPSRKGMKLAPLFPVLLTPICAPGYLEQVGTLTRPDDLARVTLLHETPKRADWSDWFQAFGGEGVSARDGDDFPNLDMAVKAALMGAGVAMGDAVLCHDELASGALVRVFPELVCPSAYGDICLIGSEDRWDDPKTRAFRDWAVGMAGIDRERCQAEAVVNRS